MNNKEETQLGEQVRYDDMLHAAMMTTAATSFQAAQIGTDGRAYSLSGSGYSVLSTAYDKDGLFASVIDKPAEDAMAAGFQWHKDASDEIKEEFKRLEMDDVFTDALRFSRLHGGALLVPVFVGQTNFETAIGRSRMKVVDYVDVISIDRVTVDKHGDDGMPLVYNVESLVQTKDGQGGSYKLHASRCIQVAGRRRPWRQVDTEMIWPGNSEGARVMASAMRLSRAFKWAEKALERKQQGVFKMKGLAAALQLKQQAVVTQRLNLVDTVRSILNTIAIDGDDEYEVLDSNLSSISDVLDSLMQELASVTGIPITVLFGRRTTSLNATGDGDTDTYYRLLNKIRTTLLRNPLQRVIDFMSAYLDVTTPDNKPLVEIAKLDTLSEFEEADVELKKAQALYQRAQAIKLLMGEPEQTATPAAPATKPKSGPGGTPVPPASTKPVVTKPAVAPIITPDQALKLLNIEGLINEL
jgi:phage-related protein (TIGR01555 family)